MSGAGKEHKTSVLAVTEDEIQIYEQMSSNLVQQQLGVVRKQCRFGPTATDKHYTASERDYGP